MILIILLLLLIASSPELQNKFTNLLDNSLKDYSSVIYAFALFLFFIFLKQMMSSLREGFFFQVSDDIKKCSGPYVGAPTTFQYDAVGSGKCKSQENPPMGYINPNGEAPMYGAGYFSQSPYFPSRDIL